ncbi:hypothetical protein ABH931_006130 [Streptacidiphilus sp. MAP12-33]|uniref:hypothetical protein n=1 Tax=Streptacidiphilus sp. MAP12-33 TaxID=3156266 RepID=UPI0035110A9D
MSHARFVARLIPWPIADPPQYEVYDRHAGGPVLGRWSYRADAQRHADECNAREERQKVRFQVDVWPPNTLSTPGPVFHVVDTKTQTMIPGSGTGTYETARQHADTLNTRDEES